MIGIYKIANTVNGKVYIGQSISIETRFNKHLSTVHNRNSKQYDYPLYRAMRKYKPSNFTFEVLEECSKSKLNQKEKSWIKVYNSVVPNGYNQNYGGNSRTKPMVLTLEQAEEIIKLLLQGEKT